MLVRILGLIDICASIVLLAIIFSVPMPIQLLLFFGGLLFVKGLFIFKGDVLSVIDICASVILLVALFFTPWFAILWLFALMLISKGVASLF